MVELTRRGLLDAWPEVDRRLRAKGDCYTSLRLVEGREVQCYDRDNR
jgi:hypothetical protein